MSALRSDTGARFALLVWRHHYIWGDLSAGVIHIVMHVRLSCHLLLRRSLRAKLRARGAAAAAQLR